MIDREVGDDAIKPGEELRIAFEARQVAVSLEEGVLADVSGLVRVMHNPERDRVCLALVPLDELAERLRVAPAGVVDELAFVRIHRGHRRSLGVPTRLCRDYSGTARNWKQKTAVKSGEPIAKKRAAIQLPALGGRYRKRPPLYSYYALLNFGCKAFCVIK